jgi:alanine dehydrogenase
VVPVATFEEAARGADIVSATTHSPQPVVHRDWLAPGTHVTSVGVNRDGPEVDAATVADALVVVESRAAALAPFPSGAAELLMAIRGGSITEDHVHAEIGELVLGTKPGRTSPDQLTLYKSVGIAAEDAAAARLVMDAAEARGLGTVVDL